MVASGKHRTHHRTKGHSDDEDVAPSWIDTLDQSIDDLNVKRLSTREKALERLLSILKQHNAMAPLASRTEELVELLSQRIQHGESPRETIMATKILGLAFINHNDEFSHYDQELLYQDAAHVLRAKAEESKNKKIQAQCYETLALLTFIISSQIDAQMIRHDMYSILVANADDEEENGDDTSDKKANNDDDDDSANGDSEDDILIATVIRAYALMFVISFCQGPVNADIIQEEMDKVIGEIELWMDFPGLPQTAGGQAVALMFETLRSATGDNDAAGRSDQNELNELIHTLRTLSMEQQDDDDDSYIFQDILATVEDGSQPYHELEIKEKSFVLDRWSNIIPLNAFQKCLGKSGLDQHYKSNDVIWKLFGKADEERSDSEESAVDEPSLAASVKYANVSKFNKSMIYQDNKKSRTKRLAAGRSGKDRL